jgi:hypothetical protein
MDREEEFRKEIQGRNQYLDAQFIIEVLCHHDCEIPKGGQITGVVSFLLGYAAW